MSEPGDAQSAAPSMTARPQPTGAGSIGGWLVLVLLWLVYVPLAELPNVVPTLSAVSSKLPDLPAPAGVLLLAQAVVNACLSFVAPVWLLILMLGYRSNFPRVYVAWIIACSAFAVFNVSLNLLVTQSSPLANETWQVSYVARPLLTTCIGLGIWVPYMLKSKRVKYTFVK